MWVTSQTKAPDFSSRTRSSVTVQPKAEFAHLEVSFFRFFFPFDSCEGDLMRIKQLCKYKYANI